VFSLLKQLINKFHSGFVNWFADLPNVPYRYVFRQLSSEVSHLHRTPLKSCHSAKIRTTVAWGVCECKSRSSACGRSNISLPICLFPSLMQSIVLQIFIKVLNKHILSNCAAFIAIDDPCKNQTQQWSQWSCISWAFFFRFVTCQPP